MNDVLPTPAAVMAWLDQAAAELDQLGKDPEAAHLALGDAEVEYMEKKDEALIELEDEYERREKRLPGEDVRLARARKRMDFEVYVRYRKAKRRVEGLTGHARRLEEAVGARQSTLKTMREGFGLEGYGKDGETFGERSA